MRLCQSFVAVSGLGLGMVAVQAKPVDFVKEIKPIFELNCVACHNEAHAYENGKYRLDTKSEAFQPRKKTQRIVPGHPDDSAVYTLTTLPPNDDSRMPPRDKGEPLTKEQTELLRRWIAEGAPWPDEVVLKTVQKIDFVRDVEEIFEQNGPLPEKSVNILRLWISQGVPWPKEAKLGSAQGARGKQPPSFREVVSVLEGGGPLSEKSKETLRLWVEHGAPWPKDFKFAPPKGGLKEKQLAMVTEIRKKILATSHERSEADMKPYTNTISGTTVSYGMVPIPGGEFLMGSPDKEPNRNKDEGPQHKVKIDPFWMGQCEVTWNEYDLFMYPDETRLRQTVMGITNHVSDVADAVTHPTRPYVEMSFGMGKDTFPAISMTQHAANSYCQWLSAKTGHFYRLPTEAEWEYACRAGTATAYSFGDDPSRLGEYAWFSTNSDFKYQKVGKKKPNPWGLYDMHGNVAEWTLDQYQSDFYQKVGGLVVEPWNKATAPYPHAVRGGSWKDDPDKLRSAARLASDRVWKMQDPQLPKSIWYHTDAEFVGFRVIRPLKVPTADELLAYWRSGVEKD